MEKLRPLGAGTELAQAYLACAWHGSGDLPIDLERVLDESQAIFEAAGDRRGVARCLAARAFAFGQSREEAVRLLHESLAISRDRRPVGRGLHPVLSGRSGAHGRSLRGGATLL